MKKIKMMIFYLISSLDLLVVFFLDYKVAIDWVEVGAYRLNELRVV